MKNLKTSLSTIFLLTTLVYSGGGIEPIEPATDVFAKPDANSTLNSKDRSLYMPRIITPEPLKSGFYAGMGLALSSLAADTSTSLFSYKDKNNRMTDLSVVAGYNFNKYLSAETRALISAAYANGVDFKSLSLFLKPKYQIYKNTNIYSLIGVGKVMANSIQDTSLKSYKTSMQVGVGVDYKLKNNFKLFTDYTYLGKNRNGKYGGVKAVLRSSALTTGISYDF